MFVRNLFLLLPLYPIKKTKFMWLDSTAIIISKRLFCYFYFFEWFWSRIHVCPVCHGLLHSFMGEDIWKKAKQKRLFFANVSQRQTTSLAPLHLLIIHFATEVSVWWKRYTSENISASCEATMQYKQLTNLLNVQRFWEYFQYYYR